MGTALTITNTFTAATKAKSGEVNTNFTEIHASLTDGTKTHEAAAWRGATGTAAEPSFAWIADTDTGFFLPTVGSVGVALSGVERFKFEGESATGFIMTAPSLASSFIQYGNSGITAAGAATAFRTYMEGTSGAFRMLAGSSFSNNGGITIDSSNRVLIGDALSLSADLTIRSTGPTFRIFSDDTIGVSRIVFDGTVSSWEVYASPNQTGASHLDFRHVLGGTTTTAFELIATSDLARVSYDLGVQGSDDRIISVADAGGQTACSLRHESGGDSGRLILNEAGSTNILLSGATGTTSYHKGKFVVGDTTGSVDQALVIGQARISEGVYSGRQTITTSASNGDYVLTFTGTAMALPDNSVANVSFHATSDAANYGHAFFRIIATEHATVAYTETPFYGNLGNIVASGGTYAGTGSSIYPRITIGTTSGVGAINVVCVVTILSQNSP